MLDNRQRDKTPELEEIEEDTSTIDENDNTQRNYSAADEQDTEDAQDEEVVAEDTEEKQADETEEIDEEDLDATEKEAKEKKPQDTKPLPDLEDRYKEQRREAAILNERNKQLTDAFVKVDEVKEPTEEELQKAARADGFEWDDLDVVQKSFFKKSFLADKKLSVVQDAVKDVRNIDEWAGKIDTFIEENDTKQTHKALSGHESEFRAFAMKATHRGIPIDMLVSHFLMTSEPTARKKGSMFLTNTGGEKPAKTKTGVDDAERAATLRTTNPREYQRLVKAGKISIEV